MFNTYTFLAVVEADQPNHCRTKLISMFEHKIDLICMILKLIELME